MFISGFNDNNKQGSFSIKSLIMVSLNIFEKGEIKTAVETTVETAR
jgi:hypothetical protein